MIAACIAIGFLLGVGVGVVITLVCLSPGPGETITLERVHEPPIKNRSTDVDDRIANWRCHTCARGLYLDVMPGKPGALYFVNEVPYCKEHLPRPAEH